MGTPRQTPVVWVQAGHVTSAVTARSRTLDVLFICPWRIWEQDLTQTLRVIDFMVLLRKRKPV